MAKRVSDGEYHGLAELRYRIRRFLQEGDVAAREAGLEPQQYLLLLAVRGLPEGKPASIRALADRLSLQHHSTVELVDRLERHHYVKRTKSSRDRRQVIVALQPRGEQLLEKVARKRIIELQSHGRALLKAMEALLEPGAKTGKGKKSGRYKA